MLIKKIEILTVYLFHINKNYNCLDVLKNA